LDTDSSLLPSALILAASLLLFSYLIVAERSAINGNGHRGLKFSFLPFKYACVTAIILSGIALALSIGPLGWWPITILALALLVTATITERLCTAVFAHRPALARTLSGPLLALMTRKAEARPANGNHAAASHSNLHTNSSTPAETQPPVITPEELTSLDNRDREMLRSILRLDVSTAREIMVHRLDMVAVEVNTSLAEVAGLMGQNGHSRLPVYEEHADNIVGVLHSRDLLPLFAHGLCDTPLREVMRPAYFVPETKRLDDLLEEMQEKGIHIAIVVDEYGGTEGLVTMEDLLEEIVGEIEDEFSRSDEPEVIHLPNGSALVDAALPTQDMEELFDSSLNASIDVDTVGGYIYQALGRIPQTGDTVVTGQLRIEVVSTLGRRLRKLRIDRLAEEDAEAIPETADPQRVS
jgi:putative hemolysin